MSDEVFEVEVDEVMAATVAAVLCVVDGDEVWIPKSQIIESDVSEVGDFGSVLITVWLAKKKGWL